MSSRGGPSFMMALSWVLLASIFSVLCPNSPNSLIPAVSAQMITDGIPGSMGVRRELRDFIQDGTSLNLYLVALSRFQQLNQSEVQSYYQVAGIHGAPYTAWDDVEANDGGSGGGYCEHASILFPTWHRPYMALYEQILYAFITDFVGSFPAGSAAGARYQVAAATWRMPYWDWAADASIPPIVGEEQTVIVELPSGFTTIPNPLYSYVFHPVTSGVFPSANNLEFDSATVRDQNGPSIILSNQDSLRNRVYNLLSFTPSYQRFSNKGWNQGNSGGADSLEGVHDTIHSLLGGFMAWIDIAAFDPIFWLHHTNVDRILALWQAVYPNSYTVNQVTPWGTFFVEANTVEGLNSPLAPFRQSDSRFWTSSSCRSTSSFGYTYPELQDTSSMPRKRVQQTVRSRINQLYGQQAPLNILGNLGGFFGRFRRSPGSPPVVPVNGALERRAVQPPSGSLPPSIVTDNRYNEWACSVKIQKSVVPGSFAVHLFLGPITTGPESWTKDVNHIGSHGFFAMAPMAPRPCNDTCNCQKINPGMHSNAIISGGLPLTSALLEKIKGGQLDSLDASCVLPYLQKNLSWKAVLVNGTILDATDYPSLKVSVTSTAVQIPDCQEDMPTTGPWLTYFSVDPAPCEGM